MSVLAFFSRKLVEIVNFRIIMKKVKRKKLGKFETSALDKNAVSSFDKKECSFL